MNAKLKKFLLKIIFIFLFEIYSTNIYSNILNYKKTNHHLIQLENIFKAHSQCLTQLQKQLLEIEQEIDHLRGQIQEIEHKMLNVTEKQNYVIKKIECITKGNLNTDKNNFTPASPKTYNHLPSSTISRDSRSCFDVYNKAVNLVLEKKQYENAIQEFQKFILKYPNSPYQANAHYWLGQLNYRQGNKSKASYHFALVAKNYPKSSKASDALLKVGIIMEENGYKDKAKLIYKQVCHLYPDTDAAKHSWKRLKNH